VAGNSPAGRMQMMRGAGDGAGGRPPAYLNLGGRPGMPGTAAGPGVSGAGGLPPGGVGPGMGGGGFGGMPDAPGSDARGLYQADGKKMPALDYARSNQAAAGGVAGGRGGLAERELERAEAAAKSLPAGQPRPGDPAGPTGAGAAPMAPVGESLARLREQKQALDRAKDAFAHPRIAEAPARHTRGHLGLRPHTLKKPEPLAPHPPR